MSEEAGNVVGVFATKEDAVAAALDLRAAGINAFEAYTPYPVSELEQLVARRPATLLPLLIFAGGVVGACWGYFIQYWDEAIDYPLNVGGRPHDSWPAFTVATFEFMVLFAIAAGFFGLLAFCKLPRLYHPIFAAEDFDRVSIDRFVLCVEARSPDFAPAAIRGVFEAHGAERVTELSP